MDDAKFDSLGAWAFINRELADEAVATTRREIEDVRLPLRYLPEKLTLTELRRSCEMGLGHPLDKSNFRRRLEERGLVSSTEDEYQTGAFRPVALYSITR